MTRSAGDPGVQGPSAWTSGEKSSGPSLSLRTIFGVLEESRMSASFEPREMTR
jgi:hypothetical protein